MAERHAELLGAAGLRRRARGVRPGRRLERPPEDVSADLGDPGHRWLTAQGPYFGAQAELEVTLTAGGVFESPTPGAVNELYGSIVLQFENCNAGTVIFDLPDIGRVGAIPIQRIAPDHAAHCQQLNEASR